MSKYGVFSGPYCPVFSPNLGKCEPEKTPYLDTFHAVIFETGKSSLHGGLSGWSMFVYRHAPRSPVAA